MARFNRIQLLLLHSVALWCAVNAGGLHPHTEGFSHQIHHPDGSTHHSTFIRHNTDVVPRNHESSVYDHGSGHVVSVHSTGPHGYDQYPGYRSQVVAARPAGGALYGGAGYGGALYGGAGYGGALYGGAAYGGALYGGAAYGGGAYGGYLARPAVTQVVAQPAVTQVVAQPAVTQVVSRPVVSQVVAPATTAVVGHGGFGAVYPGGYGYGGFGYGGYGGLRYGGAAYGSGLGYGAGLGYGGLGYGGGYGYSRTSFQRGPYIGNRRLPTAFGEVHVPHHEYHHHEHDTVHPPTYGAYGGRFVYQQPAVSVVQAPAVSVVQPAAAVYSQRFAVHAAPAAAVVHAAPAAAVVHAAPAAVVHAGGEVHHKLVGPDGTILGRLKK